LQGCVIVALQGCVIVALQGCVIVLLQGCVIVALQCCAIVVLQKLAKCYATRFYRKNMIKKIGKKIFTKTKFPKTFFRKFSVKFVFLPMSSIAMGPGGAGLHF
jgi:hypothetical protein